MTDEFVECFNCGRSNPAWAQVCRSCGVPLRHGDVIETPVGRIPRDRESLTSLAAVVGTIVLAAVIGLFVSTLNPIDPSIGQGDPTPTPTATPEASPSGTPIPSETPIPTATPPPGPTGSIVFGAGLDDNDEIVNPTDTFRPGMSFAHRVTVPEPWGVNTIQEEIVRINADGTEEVVVRGIDNQPQVVPELNYAAFQVPVTGLYEEWGPGVYEMRVFAANVLVAVGRFTFAEG